MINIDRNVIIGVGRVVLAEIVAVGTQWTVNNHLDKTDEIHEKLTGEKTTMIKRVGNSVTGMASGWAAGLISLVLTESFK